MVEIFKNTSADRERLRRFVVEHYLREGIKTPRDLHRFITTLTREPMPWKSVCPHHNTPFDYLAHAFFSDTRGPDGEFQGKVNQLVIASRGGSKTSTTGKLNMLELVFKPGIELCSVGAIKQQADKCYTYTRQWLYDPLIADRVRDSVMTKTEMWNGSTYSQLVGTLTGVNSPHPQKLRADEVELLKSEAILEEMFLVPMSNNNYRGSLDIISTRKFQYGIMQKLIERREEMNFNLVTWCYKDVAEACPIERRGEEHIKMEVIDPETEEASIVEVYEGCQHCPLVFSCRGDLARATGYFHIEDLLVELSRTSKRTWNAQMECRRPGMKGLIYPSFLDDVGNPYSTVIPNCNPPRDWIVFEGWDFGGGEAATVALWIAISPDGQEALIFDEYYQGGDTTINSHAIAVLRKENQYNRHIRWRWGDPSGRWYRNEYAQRGIIIKKAFRDVAVGIDLVNSFLDRDLEGKQHVHVCERCVKTRGEFKAYHYLAGTGVPAKVDDHSPDAARYGLASAVMILRRLGLHDLDESGRPSVIDRPKVEVRPEVNRPVISSSV